jgi:hypothetical protein
MKTTAILSVALFASLGAFSPAFTQDNIRARVNAAIEAIEQSCVDDVKAFCGTVTRGEGRVLLCMQAHEDKLSRRCEFALYRASRRLDSSLNRVERMADACWSDIEAKCNEAERIGQCLVQKRASLSQACQSVIEVLRQAVGGVVGLLGSTALSADDRELGEIVNVKREPDGKVQSVKVEAGRFLGLGSRIVEITGDNLDEVGDRIRSRLTGDQIRTLPAVKE